MGQYTDRLRTRGTIKRLQAGAEHLTGVAIIRAGGMMSMVKGSHSQLRGYEDARPGDQEGFVTSEGRFVTRLQAVRIGVEAGQLSDQWLTVRRDLLSSDINWR
jgi:hypothetical protein